MARGEGLTAELRAAFAARDVGGERNVWLYSYNPVEVDLV